MTLAAMIESAAVRDGAPLCAQCGRHHRGAAWAPMVGWHDAPGGIPVDSLIPRSGWVARMAQNAKELTR